MVSFSTRLIPWESPQRVRVVSRCCIARIVRLLVALQPNRFPQNFEFDGRGETFVTFVFDFWDRHTSAKSGPISWKCVVTSAFVREEDIELISFYRDEYFPPQTGRRGTPSLQI